MESSEDNEIIKQFNIKEDGIKKIFLPWYYDSFENYFHDRIPIAFIRKIKDKNCFYFRDIKTEISFEKIIMVNFSENGKKALVTVIKKNQKVVYLINENGIVDDQKIGNYIAYFDKNTPVYLKIEKEKNQYSIFLMIKKYQIRS